MLTNLVLFAFVLFLPALMIIAIDQNRSLIPRPKERDFGSALADWARHRGFVYAPQKVSVISGVYNDRWFAIGTANEENALRIRMNIKNPMRNHLQIFGDWLEDSQVIAFINRFRIYSSPSGLGETLFEKDSKLRKVLLKFPGLRARFDLYSDSKDPNYLHYSLLADLNEADTLEKIMASLHQFCIAFEQEIQRMGSPANV